MGKYKMIRVGYEVNYAQELFISNSISIEVSPEARRPVHDLYEILIMRLFPQYFQVRNAIRVVCRRMR